MYIGDHWPTDVIGGAALGLAFAFIAAAWVQRPVPQAMSDVSLRVGERKPTL